MLYVSGVYALNLPCSLKTTGDWHTSSLDWSKVDLRHSESSRLKGWGIESAILLPDSSATYRHADHLRAILDLFEMGNEPDFRWLRGFRNDFICTDSYNKIFFTKVLLLRDTSHWSLIHDLMLREFGSLWVDWSDSDE